MERKTDEYRREEERQKKEIASKQKVLQQQYVNRILQREEEEERSERRMSHAEAIARIEALDRENKRRHKEEEKKIGLEAELKTQTIHHEYERSKLEHEKATEANRREHNFKNRELDHRGQEEELADRNSAEQIKSKIQLLQEQSDNQEEMMEIALKEDNERAQNEIERRRKANQLAIQQLEDQHVARLATMASQQRVARERSEAELEESTAAYCASITRSHDHLTQAFADMSEATIRPISDRRLEMLSLALDVCGGKMDSLQAKLPNLDANQPSSKDKDQF